MKKINLILLSLMAAVPAGYLVYLMVMTLTLKNIWDKKVLGATVVVAGVAALLVAVWPLVYAIAFYADKPKPAGSDPSADGGSSDAVDVADADSDGEAEEFHQEDLDAFEGQEIPASDDDEFSSDDDDFEAVESGSEFDLDEDDVAQAETAEFAIADDFDEIEDFEEEEAPKKKPKEKEEVMPNDDSLNSASL